MRAFVAACECGYRKVSKTQPLADRGLATHSCERQLALAGRAERVIAQRMSEGVKRACEHKHANHQHGTRNAYVLDRCRCRPCRDAAAATERNRLRQIAYGRYDVGRVDAGPVRERCFELGRQGIGIKRLAVLTGISNSTLGRLMYGAPSRGLTPRARVARETAEKIMTERPSLELMADGHQVLAVGTIRRLQALVYLGYSLNRLAAQLNIARSNICALMQQEQVTARKARAVRDLYDNLWNTPPGETDRRTRQSASRARNYARLHGFAPPLAWDDDTIDDPKARPEGLGSARTRSAAEQRMENLEHLLDTGAGYSEILSRLDVTRGALDQAIHRAGRSDLAARLVARSDERKQVAA